MQRWVALMEFQAPIFCPPMRSSTPDLCPRFKTVGHPHFAKGEIHCREEMAGSYSQPGQHARCHQALARSLLHRERGAGVMFCVRQKRRNWGRDGPATCGGAAERLSASQADPAHPVVQIGQGVIRRIFR